MRRELSKNEIERLFVGAIDGALAEADSAQFESELAHDPELQSRFLKYQRAVSTLRNAPKEKAPPGLASLVVRRIRRRRFQMRSRESQQTRFPAEVVVPMLIAALVALFMLLSSP